MRRFLSLGVLLVLSGCTLAVGRAPVQSSHGSAGTAAAVSDPSARVSGLIVLLSAHVTPAVQWVEVDEPQGTEMIEADRNGVGGEFDGDTVHLDPLTVATGHHDYWFEGHTAPAGDPADQPTGFVHLGVDVAPEGGPNGVAVPPAGVGHTPGCSTLPPPSSAPATLTLTGAQPELLYVNVIEPDCTFSLLSPAAGGTQPPWSDTFPAVAGDGSVWVGERVAVYEGIPFHGETLAGRFIVAFTVAHAHTTIQIP